MGSTFENVDWPATAAMVQAVGSVFAIFVAIWVSRSEARRAAAAQEAAAKQHATNRKLAMNRTADLLQEVAANIAHLDGENPKGALELWRADSRALRRAQSMIDIYIDADAPAATSETLLEVRDHLEKGQEAVEKFDAYRFAITRLSAVQILEEAARLVRHDVEAHATGRRATR